MKDNINESQGYWQNWDKGNIAKMVDDYWLEKERGWRNWLVLDIKKEFGKKVPLLDVGCGTGLIYQQMLKYHVVTPATYVGGDVSKKMLAIARQRFPEAKFVNLDIFNLSYPDHSQPNVMCISVIQHLPYYDQALNELMRVTGRKLYIVSWFTQAAEDKIVLGNFYANHYSLSKFLTYVLMNSDRAVQDLRVHQYEYDPEKKVYIIVLTFCSPVGSSSTRVSFARQILDQTRKIRHSLGLTAGQFIKFKEKLAKTFKKKIGRN